MAKGCRQLTESKKEQKSYWRYKLLCGEVAEIFIRLGDLGKAYSAISLPIDQSAGYNERALVGDEYFFSQCDDRNPYLTKGHIIKPLQYRDWFLLNNLNAGIGIEDIAHLIKRFLI